MVQLTCQPGGRPFMKDQANKEQKVESDNFFEKVEKATPAQISQAVIAKVMQKILNQKEKTESN
jgi:hypothetical protein